ncbi:MAG TPA: albusnodin/ikarugamycin family macrolactam cyclase [Mycobacteriales bacterium]|nr:albusnodin/ikarugamycin family macrolactam cyclase [Mycobacteriales bacterium]
MRWFGGADGIPAAQVPYPVGARLIWDDQRPLWTVDEWPTHEVRTASRGERRLAVLGVCSATEQELAAVVTAPLTDDLAYRWPGSYTVIHQDRDGTHICTDLGWASPIYTIRHGGGTVFGSSALPLAALTGWHIDPEWLVARLVCPEQPSLMYGRSPFREVATTPPATVLTLLRDGRRQTRSVWRPATTSVREGAGLLCDALVGGIEARTLAAGAVTSDLSGGLDSGSVTMLAAAAMSAGRVHAVTLHPAGVTGGGDLDAARRVAGLEPRIQHVLLPLGREALPYTDLAAVPATDEPAASTVTVARFRTQLCLLKEFGSDCHLTGDGGDAVLTAPLTYLADLARSRKFSTLIRHATGWARLYNRSSTALLRAALRSGRTSHEAAAHARSAQLLSGDGAEPGDAGDLIDRWQTGPPALWLTPEARCIAANLIRENRCDDMTTAVGDVAALAGITMIGRCDRSEAQLTEHFGVPLHNPFLDSAVIHACLSVPAEHRTSPFAAKPLLRAALHGIVPDAVLDRRTKGDFTPDEYLGIRANHVALRELFDRPRLADLGLTEPAAICDVIERAVAGLPFDLPAFDALVATETWLTTIAHESRPRWQHATPAAIR